MPIALLTDFGTRDYFVAAMKGTMLKIDPGARFVDITHEIPPQDIRSALFVLRSCYRDFPRGTVFLCVVDPGVGSERRAIVVEGGGYSFVTPDNGLLSFLQENDQTRAYEITNSGLFAERVSTTFHGRDVFAPVAAYLSAGMPAPEVGPLIVDPVRLEIPGPQQVADDEWIGEIIHVDHFGNLVTNFLPEHISDHQYFEINETAIRRHAHHYGEATSGEVISITGSAGYIEISSNKGSAASLLKAGIGDRVVLRSGRD